MAGPIHQIFYGENSTWLAGLKSQSIGLCYLDPPFKTKNPTLSTGDAFESRAYNGIPVAEGIDAFFSRFHKTLVQVHKLLKPSGAVALHCDEQFVHRFRSLLDEVFGPENFRNEICWVLHRSVPEKKLNSHRWAPMHDRILYYAKSNAHGEKLKRTARLFHSGDVWNDIPTLKASSHELVGYPTQKPEALLRKIILGTTFVGDSILDPYCGSGTTGKVAHDLKRNFIVGDQSPVALQIAIERLALAAPTVPLHVNGLPDKLSAWQKQDETRLIELVSKLWGGSILTEAGQHWLSPRSPSRPPIPVFYYQPGSSHPHFASHKKMVVLTWHRDPTLLSQLNHARDPKNPILLFDLHVILGGLIKENRAPQRLKRMLFKRRSLREKISGEYTL